MAMATEAAPRAAPRPKTSLREVIATEKKRTSRKRWVTLAVGLALPGVIAGGAYVMRPKPLPVAALYRTAQVTEGDVVRQIQATGRLEAVVTVEVGAEISGRVAAVEADFNAPVKAGQVLARFDRAALGAQLAQVEATLLSSRALLEQAKTERDRTALDLQRTEKLYAAHSVSNLERDNARAAAQLMSQRVAAAEAQVAASRASYQIAATNLEHTVIRSPIDGVVIARNVDPGQTVASAFQTPVLFRIAADLRKMHAIAAIDEADVGEVAEGQQAELTVNAYPGRTFVGSVTQVRSAGQVVADVVTFGAEVEIDNTDFALKPGMTASVRIRTAAARNVQRVPELSLRFTPPGSPVANVPTVWELTDGRLRAVVLVPGISDGELTEVARGALPTGAAVVTELSPEGKKHYAKPL